MKKIYYSFGECGRMTKILLGIGVVSAVIALVFLFIPVSGLASDHALMVAVVIQERQDAERPVVQRDNGINEAKVRAPA